MKRILFLVNILCFFCTCNSFQKNEEYAAYANSNPIQSKIKNTGFDVMDIFGLSLENPFCIGAKGILGSAEIGLYSNSLKSIHRVLGSGQGLRSGALLYKSAEDVFIVSTNTGKEYYGLDGIHEDLRNKALFRGKDTPTYTYGRVGLAAGLFICVRAEVNWLEMIDLFTSIFGQDFLDDDPYSIKK